MDFDSAIRAHIDWKAKLSAYLNNVDKSLDAAVVARDDKCPLGQWIHGEGGRNVSSAAFATLRTQHAAFHRAAADVVRRANTGQNVKEDIAIGASSPFGTASMDVIMSIKKMKKELAA